MGEDTSDLVDGFSKYREEIKALSGVDIMKDENTYKDMYDIFVELAGVWDKMRSDEARSRVAEILGGTRQLSGIMSTITNIKDAIGAYEGAIDSAGASTRANDIYMDTATAHLQQFKVAFQELSATVVDTGLVTGLIDFGSELLNIATKATKLIKSLGGIKPVLATLATIFVYNKADNIFGFFSRLASDISNLKNAGIFKIFRDFSKGFTMSRTFGNSMLDGVKDGFSSVANSASNAQMAIGKVAIAIAAIGAVVAIIDACTTSFDELVEKSEESAKAYQESTEALKSIESELSNVKSRINELKNLDSLSITEQDELNRLMYQNELLQTQYDIEKKLNDLKMKEAAKDAAAVLEDKTDTLELEQKTDDSGGIYYAPKKADVGEQILSKREELKKTDEEILNINKELKGLDPEKDAKKYNKLKKDLLFYEDKRGDIETDIAEKEKIALLNYQSLLDVQGNVIPGFEEIAEKYKAILHIGEEPELPEIEKQSKALSDYASSVENLQTKFENFAKYQDTVRSALESSTTATGLTTEEINDLISAYGDLKDYDPATLFEETANGVHVNEEALKKLNEQYQQIKLGELADEAYRLHKEIYKQRAAGIDTTGLEIEYDKVKLLQEQYKGLTSSYNEWLNAKSGAKEKDAYESLGASYEEMKQILDSGWFGDESLNKYLDLMIGEDRTGDAISDFNKLKETIEGTTHSLMDYWQFDDDDKLVTDGLFDFLDDVRAKLGDEFASVDENGKYKFDFDKEKLEQVADAFGTTTDVIELFERALIDAGAAVDLGDISFLDEIDNTTNALKELQEAGKVSSGLNLDFDVEDDSLEELSETISSLRDERITIDAETNPEAANDLDHLINLCEKQYYFRLNAETNDGIDRAIDIITSLKQLLPLEETVSINTNFNEVNEVINLANQLAALPQEVQIAVGITTENIGNTDAIIKQLINTPDSINVPINYKKGKEPEIEDKEAKLNLKPKIGTIPPIPPQPVKINPHWGPIPTPPPVTQIINRTIITHEKSQVGKGNKNIPRYKGTAYAYGSDWSLHSSESALVNELGTESIVRDGKWFTLPGGAHIEQLKRGDIVFSAEQTKELIRTGRAISDGGHGRIALADGSAYNTLPAYDRGSGGGRRPNNGGTHSAGNKSDTSNNNNNNNNSNSSSSRNSNSSTPDSKSIEEANEAAEEFEETIDFIEIAIKRVNEAIDRMKIIADSAFNLITKRNDYVYGQMSRVINQMGLQQKAYERYMQEANSVGLDESWAQRVRDGAIDISTIEDKELSEAIKKYQEYYDKAVEAKDAIADLREEVGKLYQERFDNISEEYDNRLGMLEHLTNTYENGIDEIEERGYMATTKYYSEMQNVEQRNINNYKKKISELVETMSSGVNSGVIKEGSAAWFEMQQEINDTKESIQEAETKIIELGNSIRDLEWERFDYIQDRISSITNESEFLIDLLSNAELYDDTGQLTDEGKATMGLHGQNYNVYMAQADKYAEEMARINKALADDPNNTKLLERREELLGLQQDMISSAEDEKQAIIDMVESGIDKELDALSELINKYKEATSEAKELSDYQKNIQEKTDNISSLEKQLSAFKNDTSEENKVRVQKIEVQLKKAKDELKDTEFDHYIGEQEKLLDSLYDEYETILNERLDNVDILLSDMISNINANAGLIEQVLREESGKVGYTMTQSISDIWNNVTTTNQTITKYGENFTTMLTSTNMVLNSITAKVVDMISVGNKIATAVIGEEATYTPTDTSVSAPTVSEYAPIPSNSSYGSGGGGGAGNIHVGGQINAGGALIYENCTDTTGARQYFRNDPIYTVLREKNGYVMVRHHSISNGITGWFKKSDVTAYKTGGLVDYTGLAQLDGTPNKPELVLNSEDTANFIALKDALKSLNNKGLLSTLTSFEDMKLNILKHIARVNAANEMSNPNIGTINYEINIPIEHVSDYNDFMNQMRKDGKFEKFVQSVTIDRLAGRSRLEKNRFNW